MKKRFISIFLVFVLMLGMIPSVVPAAFASSKPRTEAQVTSLVNQWIAARDAFLKDKGKTKAYWNKGLDITALKKQVDNKEYAACLTTTKGKANSNDFKGIECNGFARYMRYVVFKEDGSWGDEYKKNKLEKDYCIKCGDILRIDGSKTGSHYVFVYKIVYNDANPGEDKIYIIDANWDGQCGVSNRAMTRNELWKVLYQVWGKAPTTIGTLTYDANGGSGTAMAPKTLKGTLSRKVVLPSCTYTYAGKTFLGWDTDPNAAKPQYKAGDPYRLKGDTTLYAIWGTGDTNPTYDVCLYNNYSGKNYFPTFDPENFGDSGFYSRDTSVVTISSDSSVKRVSGCNTMKIVSKSAGSSGNDLVMPTFTSPGTNNGYYITDQNMILSFWAKASVQGTKMYFRWGHENTYKSVTLSTDWKYYTLRMDHPTTVNHCMHPYVDRAGTVWLSEMQLEEGMEATSYVPENGGTLPPITATYGKTYTNLPASEREGFRFDGWYTAAVGGDLITSSTPVLGSHIRLYAHWSHAHTTETKGYKEATCTEEGYTGDDICTVCGQTVEMGVTTDALGHSFGAWKVTKEATCTAKGVETRYCSRCDVTETRETAALGHDYKDGVCTRCGTADPGYEPPVPTRENPFVDVKEGSVYYDAILWAYYHEPKQITGGFTATEFRPGDPCTRGQVVTFLWRAAGCPEPTGSNPFVDVQNSGSCAPYYKAIVWAAEQGITTGLDATHFAPNTTVTRAQFVTFLWRYEGKPASTGSINAFADAAKIATPFRDAVAWAVEQKITTGYEDGTFRPTDTCTRWAVVLFMYRDMT